MNVTKESITPKKAIEWLKRNIHNRPLSDAHVNRLASAMQSGVWRMNGDTIRFNGNGDLIDGQHRLRACVQSNCTFESYVVRGLDHAAFDTIDQGKRRSTGDVLARRGEKHYNCLAAAVRIVHVIHTRGAVDKKTSIRADEIVECLDRNPGVRECCDIVNQGSRSPIIPHSSSAALLFLFRQKDGTLADTFWQRVLGGEGLTSGMPEYRLRERLIDNKTSAAKLQPICILALAIKAWNAARNGKSLKCLKWDEREDFPVIQ